ncbi:MULTISPECIES: hypothetical protein [Paenibacillus]|uniref:Uncharacterized protein n=3 Tax=Paenibacillus TaxID=44249 RepID=A0AAJ2JUI9_9BACL|nr:MULTISPECIES: hypothetical protein [Paenibacillus]MCM3293064.1 hypothetical protein [Paenibacillus sp. MER 180]MCY9531418.1 hypothetical protein [Paenibacillus alvei]MDT8976517.1 hypothetical protein [Paenibacillus sp. chi10]OBY78072.1 hypothetical protein BBG47_18400 [Paenibacillus sp. KS1]TQR45999.1 hypothetical protein C7Y44_09905 [Paenibacillus sp. SDF0028]
MQSNILILEKTSSGELVKIDERAWTTSMVQLLEHANYLLVNDAEYEMLEGRLNVNTGNFELLVESVRKP